jgi:integrase/recombinase XerC
MNDLVVVQSSAVAAQESLNGEYVSRWISYIDAKPRTVETYSKALKRFFVYMNDQGIARPSREDIVSYRDYLKQEHKPTTVQGYMVAVKLFFQWTAQEGLYPNVAEHVKGAKLDREHKKDYLTSKQVVKMLGGIDTSTERGKRDYAILSLMVTSGLRTIEVVRANVEDIRTVADYTVLFIQGKGRDERTDYVKIAEPVEDAIRSYLKERGNCDGKEPLFTSAANRNNGGRLTTRSVSRLAKEHMVDVGLDSDRLTAHSLRHTTATLNLLNGGSVEETQQILRHTNINTTMIYSHALERAKNNSESRVADVIFRGKGVK